MRQSRALINLACVRLLQVIRRCSGLSAALRADGQRQTLSAQPVSVLYARASSLRIPEVQCRSVPASTAEICTETTDSCPGPGFRELFTVSSSRNVGEPGEGNSLVNEPVNISNPSYYGTEYFWSDVDFCGWPQAAIDGGRANCAGSYWRALTYALVDQE